MDGSGPDGDYEQDPAIINTWKAQRRVVRQQLTTTAQRIDGLIHIRWSRGAISGLLQILEGLLSRASQLHTNLMSVEDQTENDRKDGMHLRYIQQAEVAVAVSHPLQVGVIPDGARQAEDLRTARQRADVAQRQAEEARSQAEAASGRAEAARLAAEEARQALHQFNIEEDRFSSVSRAGPPFPSLAANWVQQQRQQNMLKLHEAPDDWIDQYAAGHLNPSNGACYRSPVSADLDSYAGKALDWFEWIDLFRALVHDTGKSPGEKLALLKRHLKGDCSDLVHGLGGGEAAYKEALVRLKQSCGRRDVMRAAHLQAIEKMELKNDPATFKRFAEKIRTHLFDLNRLGEAFAPDLIEKVCLRLQLSDRLALNEGRRGGLETRSLDTFASWLSNRAAAYQNAFSIAADQLHAFTPKTTNRPQARSHQASSTRTERLSFSKNTSRPFCFKCEGDHKLEGCGDFKSLAVGERVAFCAKHRLCFGCFGTKHSARFCAQKKPCKFAYCRLFHHGLLHDPTRSSNSPPAEASRSAVVQTGRRQCRVAMGMMRLKILDYKGDSVWANVFIDEGYDSTLMRQGFANILKIAGVRQILTVDGAGSVVNRYPSQRVGFQISTDSGEVLNVACSTLPTVASATPVTDWSTLKRRWAHLSDLPVKETGERVDILIGTEHSHLLVPLESRVGKDYEPTAIRSRLGWVIRGVIQDGATITAIRVHKVTSTTQLEELTAELRRFCDTENFGTESKLVGMSAEDRQAVAILEAGTRKLDIGYEVPITWRSGEPNFICNRQMAQQRLSGLLRRFNRDPTFESDYRAAVQKTIDKGYASILSKEDAISAKYFLAHHGVYKGTKLRVVFDAAAPFNGKCLNDAILSGPALQPSLPSVLIQFREGAVAWASDVEAILRFFKTCSVSHGSTSVWSYLLPIYSYSYTSTGS
ncbi:uncharacterized protein LOC116922554 [Daphnia magna]|uniref:uncharacterized protein LOC116922554 n=1 Tax=Daphnia magna TaxID=35525 RepID=UPI001E1BBCC4|nr:uncharacterized protein LOC116922554 [Daphnia magna]